MSTPRRHAGFSLLAALFLIVAVMLAAVAMVTTTVSRSNSTVLALQASRARFAAQGGLQIATAQALASGCAAVTASRSLEGFNVQASCVETMIDEGTPLPAYTLDVQAASGSLASNTLVSRRLRATVSTAP